jgi:ribosome biogenesis GTPase A
MNIQWFPGHMTRARREIEQRLKLIDFVIELLDARIPLASRNPMIDQIVKAKPRLILLNKADLADPACTEAWIHFFRDRLGIDAMEFDATSSAGVANLTERARQLLSHKRQAMLKKGIRPRAMRALIVGIPNVGKSTLINRLAGRQVAATRDRPGVTKGQQWIKVGKELELLDTPGILWPKFEDASVGLKLAATGAIREEILPLEDVAFHVLRYMMKRYPERLHERFRLEAGPYDAEDHLDIVRMMEEIGRRRGCLKSGGEIDLEKVSSTVLRELRSGKLGRISLEHPDEHRISDEAKGKEGEPDAGL